MLKRWLSVNKSGKKKTQGKHSGNDGNPQFSVGESHSPSGIEVSTKPVPITKGDDKRKTSSSSSNRQLSSPPNEMHSINDTLRSMNSASVDWSSDFEFPDILAPKLSEGMPYGDGSCKVFGYENFGNTCYCNSVLQCLYNLTEFRTLMLQYPERDPAIKRKRKSEMRGNKPRYFTESSFESASNGVNSSDHHNHQKNRAAGTNNAPSSSNHNVGGSSNNSNGNESTAVHNGDQNHKGIMSERPVQMLKRNSSFMLGKHGNNGSVSNNPISSHGSHTNHVKSLTAQEISDGSNNQNESPQPVHATIIASDVISEKIHESSQKVIVGRPLLIANHPTNSSISSSVGDSFSNPALTHENIDHDVARATDNSHSNETPFLSNEQRKKSALIRGPVLNIDHLLNESGESNLFYSLKDIFESITENTSLTGVVSPISFVEVLKRENILFNTTMHQDAHEFLNFLLNELSDCIQKNIESLPDSKRSENFINKLFQGTLTNRIKCLTCDTTTSRVEPFLDFPIEVKDDEETDIQAVFKGYQQREMLSGSNKFYCNECCGLQEAERVVGLKQLPHILALHLKRFKYSEEQNSNIKLFNKIRYPLMLNVCSTFSSISKTYELNGIVVHMGGGPQHGHYVSLCKTERFGWLLFDDETVESVNEDTVLKFVGDSHTLTTAYVLFYKEVAHSNEKDSSNDSIDEIQDNIEQLIKYDDLISEKLSKTPPIPEDNILEEVPEGVAMRVDGERKTSSSSSSAKARPKSRLFNFMKN